jgi:hypothetical protein
VPGGGSTSGGRLRLFWRSLVALSLLVAVAGGFVLAATAAARRTTAAIPGFVARPGSNAVAYGPRPLPQLARLPGVVPVPVVHPLLLAGLAAGVLAAANVLPTASQPGECSLTR